MLRGLFQELPATVPTLVVLAAGLGSRFGGDKQFTALGPRGETLMDYAIFDAARAGIDRVVLIVRPDALDLPALQRRYDRSVELSAVVQRLDDLPPGMAPPAGRTRPWGTAQAILAARAAVVGAFVVVNGDDYYGAQPYQALVDAREADGADAATWHLAGFGVRDTLSLSGPVNRAVCRVGADGMLTGLDEVRGIVADSDGGLRGGTREQRIVVPPEAIVSMNMWGLTPEVFEVIEEGFKDFLTRADRSRDEYFLPEAIAEEIPRGRKVKVIPAKSHWCGVTFPADAAQVRAHLARLAAHGDYPAPLWP